MRNKLIIGNWKMHGSVAENAALTMQLIQGVASLDENIEIAVCPCSVHISQIAELLAVNERIALGAQDVNENDKGAFTGEVSAAMVREFSVKYVLLGHSERRTLYAESDERIAAKFLAVVAQQLTPVLCIGETLVQKEQGETKAILLSQLDKVLKVTGAEHFSKAIIAYEPVWAIGTGKTASPEQAQAVHKILRDWLTEHLGDISQRIQLLYGGSVNPDNAGTLFTQDDIDGGLIGGASLNAAAFLEICAAAQQ